MIAENTPLSYLRSLQLSMEEAKSMDQSGIGKESMRLAYRRGQTTISKDARIRGAGTKLSLSRRIHTLKLSRFQM